MNWRVHFVSLAVFISSIVIFRYIWNNPKIILYVIIGLIALLGYIGIYLIVKAKIDRPQ